MQVDLTLAPLHRVSGREVASLPGLSISSPRRSVARGREHTASIVYLILTGNATFTSAEYAQLARLAEKTFFETSGSTTNALRAAAEAVNVYLLERNTSTRPQGQYASGWLTICALREDQATILISGPMHLFWMSSALTHSLHDPALAGRGLGLSQTFGFHLAQAVLASGDRFLFCGRLPSAWPALLGQESGGSLYATRRRLVSLTSEDLNGVLILATQGEGRLNLLGEAEREEPRATTGETRGQTPPASGLPGSASHGPPERRLAAAPPAGGPAPRAAPELQASAYAIPPDSEIPVLSTMPGDAPRDFPASIPRMKAAPDTSVPDSSVTVSSRVAIPPPGPSARTRRWASTVSRLIQAGRQSGRSIAASTARFLPRLLPTSQPGETLALSGPGMVVIALLVPVIVVVLASLVYLRYGRSVQYETYLAESQALRIQALQVTNPAEQRAAWEAVLLNVSRAESNRRTSETSTLRQEAEGQLDALLGIVRLQYQPAFSTDLGIEISRLAAGDNDLFMLDPQRGEVLHAQVTSGRRFEWDAAFHCSPGVYGAYTVGPIVDILALPGISALEATVLGVDAAGNLLYCKPGQVAQAIPLPPPDTNWGRVTAMTIDAGDLYVLDAPARAVWVYAGRDGTFIDRPYFFFGGQTPEKQDVIDLAVSGDDLYLLHADGHLSTCSYSRIESVPTRCEDPATMTNPFVAYASGVDGDPSVVFTNASFTQMLFTAPPDQSILLLDADTQGVFRITPRSLELQNQVRPTTGEGNPIPQGPVGAMAISPSHVLFLAVRGQVYFASGMP